FHSHPLKRSETCGRKYRVLEVAQRATGVIRLATLCAQSQKRILELERELASQSEELVDLQANLLSILREKVGNEALFWGAW
ncbi:hypothetical protein UA70_29625, partial [Raoultella planticola]